jgi:hypothetical protein
MTASMDYCQDNNLRLLDPEVDSEGKARHQRPACTAMNYRVSERLFGNRLKSRKCFVQEFVPESRTLLLVP